jgi:hypothetical protein
MKFYKDERLICSIYGYCAFRYCRNCEHGLEEFCNAHHEFRVYCCKYGKMLTMDDFVSDYVCEL